MTRALDPPKWFAYAACIDTDPNVFFPRRRDLDAVGARSRAIAICAPCPVRPQCLDFALAEHIDYGIWGGMTTRERQEEARRRRQMRRTG